MQRESMIGFVVSDIWFARLDPLEGELAFECSAVVVMFAVVGASFGGDSSYDEICVVASCVATRAFLGEEPVLFGLLSGWSFRHRSVLGDEVEPGEFFAFRTSQATALAVHVRVFYDSFSCVLGSAVSADAHLVSDFGEFG